MYFSDLRDRCEKQINDEKDCSLNPASLFAQKSLESDRMTFSENVSRENFLDKEYFSDRKLKDLLEKFYENRKIFDSIKKQKDKDLSVLENELRKTKREQNDSEVRQKIDVEKKVYQRQLDALKIKKQMFEEEFKKTKSGAFIVLGILLLVFFVTFNSLSPYGAILICLLIYIIFSVSCEMVLMDGGKIMSAAPTVIGIAKSYLQLVRTYATERQISKKLAQQNGANKLLAQTSLCQKKAYIVGFQRY